MGLKEDIFWIYNVSWDKHAIKRTPHFMVKR
jgi:hypothetical protein